MEWASILWRVGLGVMLFSLGILFLYLCVVLNSIRKNLRSLELLTHQDVSPLLKDVDQTVKTLNDELPQLLQSVHDITVSLHQISASEIHPMTHNIQEMTETVNRNVAKIDELIELLTHFSQQTVKRAEHYRDELSIPITDIISAWSGIRAGLEVFRNTQKRKNTESENGSEKSNSGDNQNGKQ
jgi:methyl-accepting chemotaxis protein